MPPERDLNPSAAFETKDLNLRPVALGVGFLLLALAAVVFLLKPLFQYQAASHRLVQSALDPASPDYRAWENRPAPQLEPYPREDAQVFRAHEEAVLNGYGWADPDHRFARIPIAQAMERLLKEGLPTRRDADGR